VSAPIDWDELEDPDLRPDGFTIRTVLARVAERGDPFRSVLSADQRLPALR
jgi:bifunctional non-homologous end joining protein LigD